MSILGAFILPHPPLILPEVGNGKEKKIQKTIDACDEIAKRISAINPDTIVLVTPHSIMYSDYFHISPGDMATGNMGQFSAPELSVSASYDTEFVRALEQAAAEHGIFAGTQGEKKSTLDHGTMIPLFFISKELANFQLVRISISGLTYADHYRLGMCVRDVAEKLERKTVFVASADLSHKLLEDGPYGISPEGADFDHIITEAMATGDFLRFMTFSPDFCEKAGECGLRSCIMMAGALDKRDVIPELLCYEGTFGVGYGVASYIPRKVNERRGFLDLFLAVQQARINKIKDSEDPFVRLARHTVEKHIAGKLNVLPKNTDEMKNAKAGVFVSIKKHGMLRGCIGTIAPTTASIAEEICKNAVSAAVNDTRFEPIGPLELDDLVYSVDVLSLPEPIASPEMLDVQRYGVIVTSGNKRGLLLPNLEGVDSVRQQIDIARQKAGIDASDNYSLERFEVVRHT